jgi:hypothetical protein
LEISMVPRIVLARVEKTTNPKTLKKILLTSFTVFAFCP